MLVRMCGRATLSTPPEDLRELFGLDETPELTARYNIAPTQPIAVVRQRPPTAAEIAEARARGERRIHLVRWGMIPAFAKDPKIGARMINARVESLTARPPFRDALEKRRCLVAVDGFYEWQSDGTTKRPFLVHRRDGAPFALAGLWDRWRAPSGDVIDSCTVITAPSAPPLQAIHDRMPIVMPPARWDEWLDPSVRDPERLLGLLEATSDELILREVSTRVNSAANDDPSCVAPIAST